MAMFVEGCEAYVFTHVVLWRASVDGSAEELWCEILSYRRQVYTVCWYGSVGFESLLAAVPRRRSDT